MITLVTFSSNTACFPQTGATLFTHKRLLWVYLAFPFTSVFLKHTYSDALAGTGLPQPSSFLFVSAPLSFSYLQRLIIWDLTPLLLCGWSLYLDAGYRKSLFPAKKLSLQQSLHCLVYRLNKTRTQLASHILLALRRARWQDDWDSWLNLAAYIVSSQKQVLTDSG